jgi:hypothetical protein
MAVPGATPGGVLQAGPEGLSSTDPRRIPPSAEPTIRRPVLASVLLALAAAAVAPAAAAHAQQVPASDSVPVEPGVSPRGAFLRAIAIPGWGHAAARAHTRGAFYVAAQGGTVWMLVRTRARLGDARRLRDVREEVVRTQLAIRGVTDPLEIEAALTADERVARARGLMDARQQQFEDWMALGIFMVLLSGADAFVSAHLQNFPAPMELEVRSGENGRVEVGARVPLPRGR